MATFDIESLGPTDGPCPTNRYDSVSGASFIVWKPGDEALVMFRIPYGFTSGSRVRLIFNETIPATGLAYSWDIESRALNQASNLALPVSNPYTSSTRFLSSDPSAVGLVAVRTIPLVDDHGMISGAALNSGDALSVRIKLAIEGSDPALTELSTFAYRIELAVDTESFNVECVGRVASIIRATRDLFNEDNSGFLRNDFILRSINECLKVLARENYWSAEKILPAVAGQNTIELASSIPDLQSVQRVRFNNAQGLMTELHSLEDYLDRSARSCATGPPVWYFIRNGLMKVWPAPSKNLDSGFHVYYSRLPQRLGCSEDNCDPPVPPAHDSLFTMFALRQAFLRDRNAPGADLKFQEYSRLYELEKRRLLGVTEPASAIIKPRR
jgi:hypothetical protein